ncbi:hypothetical protein CERSUDRAFT_98618 [Gelatoporia subvermispora B]|uniref:Uncharacterized protein n=1 Tax=Ceriporiopsis subvermispora (strain B) TaxID=914234 RepID=M2QMX8_CERS8|nr:hypothetical protein CERSUDRAFT_98618 [Gelatoporia subvermispora B]
MARLRTELDSSGSSGFWHTRVSPKKPRFGRPRTPVPFSESHLDALQARPDEPTSPLRNDLNDRRVSTLSTASSDKPLPTLPPGSPYLAIPSPRPARPASPARSLIRFPRHSSSFDLLSPRRGVSPRPMSPAQSNPALSFIRFPRQSYGAIYKNLGINIPSLNRSTRSLDRSPYMSLRSGLGSEWSLVSCPELAHGHTDAEGEDLTVTIPQNRPADETPEIHAQDRVASPTMSSMALWWNTEDDARSSYTASTRAPSPMVPPSVAPSEKGSVLRKFPKALRPVVVLRRNRMRSSRGAVFNQPSFL